MNEILQFRSEAMAFANSSSGNKTFFVKEEFGFSFKMTFRKPNEKFTAIKSKSHSRKPCLALSKNATPVKK